MAGLAVNITTFLKWLVSAGKETPLHIVIGMIEEEEEIGDIFEKKKSSSE